MKKILLLIHLLFSVSSFGQVFPVQVTPQITPPYSPYLSDYTAPGAQNFMVHIRANDVTLSGYRCKLRLTIEGVGISIRTKPGLITAPIILEGGGTSHVYYGSDLLSYFHPDALDFSGISKSQYVKTARLPEGVYRFSVEVLDYNRGTVVSNKGIAMAWIVVNDPPILNTPANFSKVEIQDPVNILFSWTPRHSSSPNAAFSTEYTFRMIELWPDDRDPYDAFLSQLPLYEATTTQNQLLYGMDQTALTPGRKYAWQVQARDLDGRDLFRNHGRSEVHVFQYGEALDVPKNLHMRWAKPTTLAIKWNAVSVPNQEVKYRLQWRPRRRSDDQQWYETRTKFTDKTLYHLAPSTEYEMKVRTETPLQESDYSEIQIFKTLPPDEQAFICKTDIAPPPLPANNDPVFPLRVNDTIHAGGYDVLVRDVMNVDNKYFGSGVAIVPWFNSAKIRVTFENIGVNDRFWLKSGTIKSVWNTDGDFLFEEQVVPMPGAAPQAGALDITVVATDSLIAVSGTVIVSVDLDTAGNIVVTTTDGKEETLAGGESYAIVDEMGNGYVVDEKGNIAKTTATQATATATRGDRSYDLVFKFFKGGGRFGFDEKKYEALAHYYQIFGDGTFASWKAISSGTGDMIMGQLSSTDVKPDDITFEVGGAHLTPASREGNNITLTVQGMHEGIEEELLALHRISDTIPAKVLGKVNLVTYNPLRYQLQIVPVNDASVPGRLDVGEIARRLNDIYDQAVVEWEVSMSDVLTVPLNETFDEGETGLLSNYTPDMKKVLSAFGRLHDNTYYLFLIESPTNASTLGYMPRNRRAGFVFTGPHHGNVDEFIKTIAHELGHGAFNLKHTFSEHNLPGGMTDNMMDYSDGTALYKYQWDYIHDPQAVMGLFEEDEEGESVIVTNLNQLKEFANPNGSFTFMAPTGDPFTLPPDTEAVMFWTNDTYADGIIQPGESPDGAIIAFTIGKQTYRYHKIVDVTTGSGYKTRQGELPYVDLLTKKQKDLQHAIIGLPCVNGGQVKFIAQKIKFTSEPAGDNHTAEGNIVSKLPIEDPYELYYKGPRLPITAKLDFSYSDEAIAFLQDNEACLNEMARYVIQAADVIQTHPGYYERYKTCTGNPLAYPKPGSSSTEDAVALGIYYERLRNFADELLTYAIQTKNAYTDLLDTNDPDKLNALLKNTCAPDFTQFTFEQRKHIIEVLSTGNMHDYWLGAGNNRENIVIHTLQQAPEEQYGELLDLLSAEHYALLKRLIRKSHNQLIGEDNFDRLIDAVTVMIQKEYVYETFERDIYDDRVLRWGANDLFHGFDFSCNDWVNNQESEAIIFSSSSFVHHYPAGGEYTGVRIQSEEETHPPLEVAPFDFVPLKLYDDIILESGKPIINKGDGEFQAVPAIYMYWMLERKATDETLTAIKANVNTALFLIGGAEIIAAKSAFRVTLAIVDQATFATSFVIEAGPRRILEEGPNGEQWQSIFKAFDAFNLLYGVARIGDGLALAAQDLLAKRAMLNQLKEVEDWARLTPGQESIVKANILRMEEGMDELGRTVGVNPVEDYFLTQDEMWDDLADISDAAELGGVSKTLLPRNVDPLINAGMLEGWTTAKVLAYGRGNYPAVELYLSKSYISNHLKEFEDGVSFLCPLDALKRYANLLGRTDGVFVMPKGRMDELLTRTKGDFVLIEAQLGIPAGNWSSKKMCRVNVMNIEGLNIRMATGNEAAANEYFTPGGFTKNGEMEAVTDPVPKSRYTFKVIN